MVVDWITVALVTFIGILPIANPFSTAVVFLTITEGSSDERKRQQARMACIYMTVILIIFLLAGTLIMSFFGISIPGLRIAGGLIVLRIGFEMLDATPGDRMSDDLHADAVQKEDVAFTPLAMPMLSGPGSIAVTIGMAAEARGISETTAIIAGIGMVAYVSYLVLRGSKRVVDYLGTSGTNALGRVMGFLLVCVGIQFVVDGSHDILASPEFLDPILELIRR